MVQQAVQRRRRRRAVGAPAVSAWIAVDGLVRAKALEFGHGAVQFKGDLPRMADEHVNFPDGGLGHALERMQAQRFGAGIGLQKPERFLCGLLYLYRRAPQIRYEPPGMRKPRDGDAIQCRGSRAANRSSALAYTVPVVGCSTASCVAIHSRSTSIASCSSRSTSIKALYASATPSSG